MIIQPDTCPDHPDRPIYARGVCHPCYQRLRYHGALDTTGSPDQRTCAQCGAIYTPKTSAARARFCSTQCKGAAAAARRPPKARGNDGSCAACGKSLTGMRADARYCGETCRHLRYVGPGVRKAPAHDVHCRCGKLLADLRSNGRWCSPRCHNLWRLYGLTAPEVDALISRQGGGCAICGTTEWGNGGTPSVDHCHNSLRIRGILCARCNGALGLVDDDPVRLRAAAVYLERTP